MRQAAACLSSLLLVSCVPMPGEVSQRTLTGIRPELRREEACPGIPKVADAGAALALGQAEFRNIGIRLTKASLAHGVWVVTDPAEEFGTVIARCNGEVLYDIVTSR